MPQKIVIHGSLSSFYGWGIYGLNLVLPWSADPEVEPVCSLPFRLFARRHPTALLVTAWHSQGPDRARS